MSTGTARLRSDVNPPTFNAAILETLEYVRTAKRKRDDAERATKNRNASPVRQEKVMARLKRAELRLDSEVEGLLDLLAETA